MIIHAEHRFRKPIRTLTDLQFAQLHKNAAEVNSSVDRVLAILAAREVGKHGSS